MKKNLNKTVFKIFLNFSLFSLLLMANNAYGQDKGLPPDSEEKSPQDTIEQYRKRESKNLALHKVKGKEDLNVLSSEAGKSQALDKESWYIAIPIGAESPVECILNKGNQSPVYILNNLFQKVKGNKNLKQIAIRGLSGGEINKLPYVYLETEYISKDDLYGDIKSMSIASLGFSVTCFHDEVGYEATFKSVIESIAKSDAIQGYFKKISPYEKRQISLVKINDHFSGYLESFLFKTEEGQYNYYTVTNLIFMKSQNEILVGESADDVYTTLDSGVVVKAKYESYESDTTQYTIEINKKPDNKYEVKGEYKGKQVNKVIDGGKDAILSVDFISDKILEKPKKFLNKAQKFYEYHPSEPEKFTKAEIKLTAFKDKVGSFSYKVNQVNMEFKKDEKGSLYLDSSYQKTKVITERIFAE